MNIPTDNAFSDKVKAGQRVSFQDDKTKVVFIAEEDGSRTSIDRNSNRIVCCNDEGICLSDCKG